MITTSHPRLRSTISTKRMMLTSSITNESSPPKVYLSDSLQRILIDECMFTDHANLMSTSRSQYVSPTNENLVVLRPSGDLHPCQRYPDKSTDFTSNYVGRIAFNGLDWFFTSPTSFKSSIRCPSCATTWWRFFELPFLF